MARKRGRGSVRYHRGSFAAAISMGGKRYTRAAFDREADAWEWIATVKADHLRGVLGKNAPEPPATPITFGDLARLLAVHKTTTKRKPWRPGTARFVREHLQASIFPAFESRQAASISAEELQAWLDAQHGREARGRHKGNITAATVRKIESVLSMVLRYGVKIGRLKVNPMARVERTSLPEDQEVAPARVLRPEELRRILDAAAPARNRAFFTVLALTGLRRSEAFRMRWSWVDFDARILRVQIAKKGRSEVPMGPRVIAALRSLGPGQPDDLVFPGFVRTARRGDRSIAQKLLTDMRRPMAAALTAAGVDPAGIALHTFRRTFLTILESLPGIQFSHVVALARHSRKAQGMTARYLLPSMEELHEDLVELERRVFGGAVVRLLRASEG